MILYLIRRVKSLLDRFINLELLFNKNFIFYQKNIFNLLKKLAIIFFIRFNNGIKYIIY